MGSRIYALCKCGPDYGLYCLDRPDDLEWWSGESVVAMPHGLHEVSITHVTWISVSSNRALPYEHIFYSALAGFNRERTFNYYLRDQRSCEVIGEGKLESHKDPNQRWSTDKVDELILAHYGVITPPG